MDFIFPEEKFSPRKNFGKDFEEISSVINALRASIIRLPPRLSLEFVLDARRVLEFYEST